MGRQLENAGCGLIAVMAREGMVWFDIDMLVNFRLRAPQDVGTVSHPNLV